MNRRIPIVFGIIVIALAIVFILQELSSRKSLISNPESLATTTTEVSSEPNLKNERESVRDEALNAFKKYLEAAKNHDLLEIRKLSYQISETCRDSSKTNECNALMDNAYFFGSQIATSTLTNMVFDSKQIILTNNYIESIESDILTATRAIVYFVRDNQGVKLLSLNPYQGTIILRGDMSTSTAISRLHDSIADSDQDSLPDKTELCTDGEDAQCVQTNPDKKDSDGDLWWDSTESLFYKK